MKLESWFRPIPIREGITVLVRTGLSGRRVRPLGNLREGSSPYSGDVFGNGLRRLYGIAYENAGFATEVFHRLPRARIRNLRRGTFPGSDESLEPCGRDRTYFPGMEPLVMGRSLSNPGILHVDGNQDVAMAGIPGIRVRRPSSRNRFGAVRRPVRKKERQFVGGREQGDGPFRSVVAEFVFQWFEPDSHRSFF